MNIKEYLELEIAKRKQFKPFISNNPEDLLNEPEEFNKQYYKDLGVIEFCEKLLKTYIFPE